MNERIKELAEQAGMEEDTILQNFGFEPSQFKWTGHGRDIEKFAELIIQEVINEAADEIQFATSHAIANEICETLERKFGIR